MEVKITQTRDSPLLGRKEVEAEVHFTGATPTRKDIKETICGKIGANRDLAVLREVHNEYGMRRVTVLLHIYENEEKLRSIEPAHMVKKEGLEKKAEEKKEGEEKPAEEAPAKEEAPKEEPAEKKEEPAKEAKKEEPEKKEEAPKEEPKKE